MAFSLIPWFGVLILLSSITDTVLAERSCKALPNQPGWPTPADWETLNTTLGGVLLKPDPPAAACHASQPAYNPEKCAYIKSRWNDSSWHSDNPISSLFQNLNGYSCPPTGTTCSSDGYPVYVVNATTTDHIKAAVNFARQWKIRLNIKSTGHDFFGKSVQPKSLSIWTHHLKSQEWFEKGYPLQTCNTTLDGVFVKSGSGTQMRQLYRDATDRKLIIVGGSSGSVSLGGYITGGGHSLLSPWLGMGGDHVVELEIVTPDGNLIVANECLNPDIFWAARGGGGSTFGVTTSLVILAHPAVPITIYQGTVVGNTNAAAIWEATAHLYKEWPIRLTPLRVGGYVIGPASRSGATGALSLTLLAPGTNSPDTLKEALEPILDVARRQTTGKLFVSGSYIQMDAYGDYLFPSEKYLKLGIRPKNDDLYPGNGHSKLMTTWLWNAKAVAHPNIKNVLREAVDNGTTMFANFVGPPATDPPFVRGGGNAVNPAWKGAIVRPASQMDWTEKDSYNLKERLSTLTKFGDLLRSIDPSSGTYANEADYQTVNFQRDFWGDNYPRLYDIKKRVDPDGVFWCRTCVGSELWEESAEGELCKK